MHLYPRQKIIRLGGIILQRGEVQITFFVHVVVTRGAVAIGESSNLLRKRLRGETNLTKKRRRRDRANSTPRDHAA